MKENFSKIYLQNDNYDELMMMLEEHNMHTFVFDLFDMNINFFFVDSD